MSSSKQQWHIWDQIGPIATNNMDFVKIICRYILVHLVTIWPSNDPKLKSLQETNHSTISQSEQFFFV